MKFFTPKLRIASLLPPQTRLCSKFGGLPWGLPLKLWSRCQVCSKLMSLLAQLNHDPPALDLGSSDYVLHLFQCQECYGYEPGSGNDAVLISIDQLGGGLTQLPPAEDLGGVLGTGLDAMVGELWIEGWREQDDHLDPALAKTTFDQDKWMALPDDVTNRMFEPRWRTKMGGIPYWTGNGPLYQPRRGYEFLFQLDTLIEFKGTPPTPDEVGGMVVITSSEGHQDYRKPSPKKKKRNAPWYIDWSEKGRFCVSITNLGTDGTAYVFINRRVNPAKVYWFWNR